ncbi:hypothetical protein L484_009665 [Morus notabilis]|uniref:Uncharacterized protein n=1 Tax=Morus notabilis TaxID=981085 RepID=W9RM02_9ROSA|nr:protein GLUTAMINE DUMPER 6 [Morus notabilis]EXB85819.1 hypothetical protein L484_009665 [Morus notabilis]
MRELTATLSATSSPSPAIRNSAAANKHLWKSPIPYLFGSLAAMFLLISLALVLLICSYHKRPYGGRDPDHEDDHDQKSQKRINAVDLHADEPRIVVIMAGDDNPTYLATPVEVVITCASSTNTTSNVVICSAISDDNDHDHGDHDRDQPDV